MHLALFLLQDMVQVAHLVQMAVWVVAAAAEFLITVQLAMEEMGELALVAEVVVRLVVLEALVEREAEARAEAMLQQQEGMEQLI